jgi:sterol desaturase/sphingolipid hydroxylase (fatty acid hydroxylase superfamily)
MWADFLKNTVLKPALQRLLPIGAALLVGGGDWLCQNWNACGLVTVDGAHQVMAYVIAVALLIADLVIEAMRRAGHRDKVASETLRDYKALVGK